MDLLKRVPNKFKKSASANDLTTDNQYRSVNHTILVLEATARLAPILSKIEEMAERREKIRQRLAGLDLRIDVIQDEIQRLKKVWKVL